jgi:nucleotide-binding universal stress UspA family protein
MVNMKILVAYDGSPCADAAIQDTLRAGLAAEAETRVLCIAGELSVSAETDTKRWQQMFSEAEALAQTASNRLQSFFPNWKISTEVLWGWAPKVVLELSRAFQPDLVIVGSRGRSPFARLFLGSVSLELVHKAACPVRVARAGRSSSEDPVRILIASDGSPQAEAVIRSVARRSWPNNTEVRIVCVAQPVVPTPVFLEGNLYAQEPVWNAVQELDRLERARLEEAARNSAETLRSAGLVVSEIVVSGDPREVIIAEADRWNSDSIFIGARGLGRMERLLLGSVSSHVVNHAHCTVEVVR